MLLKLYQENNENKQKEAGIGPFKKTIIGNVKQNYLLDICELIPSLIHPSADSTVDCIDAEIGIFLSLPDNTTVLCESADRSLYCESAFR